MSSQTWRSLKATPGWSLRYCEWVGSRAPPRASKDRRTVYRKKSTRQLLPENFQLDADVPSPEKEVLDSKARKIQRSRESIQRLLTKDPASPKQQQVLKDRIISLRASGKKNIRAYLDTKRGRVYTQPDLHHSIRASLLEGLSRNTDLTKHFGVSESEIQMLHDIFVRYDLDSSETLDQEEIRYVLADLGMEPSNKAEKQELAEVLDDEVGDLECINFPEFMAIYKAMQDRLQELQLGQCWRLFDTFCKDKDSETGQLVDLEQMRRMLEEFMGCGLQTQRERDKVTSIFTECDRNGDGKLDFDDFLVCVQRARTTVTMMRREEEITLAKKYHLEPATAREFQLDLVVMHDVFQRFARPEVFLRRVEDLNSWDEGDSGVNNASFAKFPREEEPRTGTGWREVTKETVQREDIVPFLLEIGVVPSDMKMVQRECAEQVVAEQVEERGRKFVEGGFSFKEVLNIIKECRRQIADRLQEELCILFENCDRDGDGKLSMNEIFQILEEFQMLPRSREEQQEIARVLERMDVDGSGTFDIEEYQDLFERLSEQVRLVEREREYQDCLAMGVSKEHLAILRRQFLYLNPDFLGRVILNAAYSSLKRVKEALNVKEHSEDALRAFNKSWLQNPDSCMDYRGFVQTIKSVFLDCLEEPEESQGKPPANPGAGPEKPTAKRGSMSKSHLRWREEGFNVPVLSALGVRDSQVLEAVLHPT